MAQAKPLHLRMFLEGVEVPIVSAQVSINVNAPASAALQVVPLDEVLALKPRTMVHVFFLDVKPDMDPQDPARVQGLLSDYHLLFSGEVVGFSYIQTPMSRATILQCLDFSSYWDSAHSTAIEYGPGGNLFTNTASLHGSETSQFDDIVNQQADKIVSWLGQRPQTPGLTGVSGLAGGVIRMLEAMGGIPHHSKGVNDFFSVAELRCRLLAQISAEENDDTAKNLMREKVFDEWLRNGLQNIGQQVTFRDMLKLLFQYVYYEVVPNPAAKFDASVGGGKTKTTVQKESLSSHPIGKRAAKTVAEAVKELEGSQNYKKDDPIVEVARKFSGDLTRVIAEVQTFGRTKISVSSDVNRVVAALTRTTNALDAIKNPADGKVFAAPVAIAREALSVLQTSKEEVVSHVSTTSDATAQRLRTQIIRPDCFFAAPPKCNVIFPEQYTQLAYDRMFVSEVTRSLVMVYNTLIGQDALLAERVLAPNLATDIKNLTKTVGSQGYRTLMDHELHTGIIPRMEWLPNTSAFAQTANPDQVNQMRGSRLSWASRIALFHFFKYRFGPRQANLAGRFNPNVVCGFPALIIKSPFIVPGISQSLTATDQGVLDLIQTKAEEMHAPSQLVGMVGSVQHMVDQNGGTTSMSLHHVREHLGVDDEFLNIFSEVKGKTKKRTLRVVLTAQGVKDDPRLQALLIQATPQDGATQPAPKSLKTSEERQATWTRRSVDPVSGAVKEEQVTSTYTVAREVDKSAPEAHPVVEGRVPGKEQALVPSPPPKLQKGVFGTVTAVEVLKPGLVQLPGGKAFEAVALYEEVAIPVTASVPVEDIIRPTWFSPAYSNEQIGEKVYQPFFGTDSIIDEVAFDGVAQGTGQVVDPTGSPLETDPTKELEALKKELIAEEKVRARVSIERAVNFISYVYGVVKARDQDVDEFIRSFTSRPIATLTDILGETQLSLQVSPDGKVSVPGVSVPGGGTRPAKIGFHSMAIHPTVVERGGLAGLTVDPEKQLQRINNTGAASAIPPKYDVRKEKRDRVLRYIEALNRSRSPLGSGFRG